MEGHAVAGSEQIAAVAGPEIAELVRHQHERVDGGGYPDGLARDEIPLGARIIAVADRADELIAPAPRRSRRGRRNVLDELSARAGSELDAAVVAAFVAYYSGRRSIAGAAFAATAPQRAVRWLAAAPGATLGAAGAPVALQSMCAAGATVLAGACLTGLPALSPERDGDRPGPAPRADRPASGSAAGDGTERASTAPVAQRRGKRDPGEKGDPGRRGSGGGDAPSDVPRAIGPHEPGRQRRSADPDPERRRRRRGSPANRGQRWRWWGRRNADPARGSRVTCRRQHPGTAERPPAERQPGVAGRRPRIGRGLRRGAPGQAGDRRRQGCRRRIDRRPERRQRPVARTQESPARRRT